MCVQLAWAVVPCPTLRAALMRTLRAAAMCTLTLHCDVHTEHTHTLLAVVVPKCISNSHFCQLRRSTVQLVSSHPQPSAERVEIPWPCSTCVEGAGREQGCARATVTNIDIGRVIALGLQWAVLCG